jgi:hypothetical protein
MTAPRPILTRILIFALFAVPLAVEAQQTRVYQVGDRRTVRCNGPGLAALAPGR